MNIERMLEDEEGRERSAYLDSKGFWTIGVGRLIDKRKGGGLSEDEIDYLLANDIRNKTSEVARALPWLASLNEPRRVAIVGMAFQLGTAGMLGFRRAIAAARDERWDVASAEMLDSKWAKEDTPARAHRMAQQMKTGEWQ
jgi:lysozyme